MKKFLKKIVFKIAVLIVLIVFILDLIVDVMMLVIGLTFGIVFSLFKLLIISTLRLVGHYNKETAMLDIEQTYKDYIKNHITSFKNMREWKI